MVLGEHFPAVAHIPNQLYCGVNTGPGMAELEEDVRVSEYEWYTVRPEAF
jgi:hypothetical protein